MEDKAELIHGIREELEKAADEAGSGFSDLVTGTIIGFGIADKLLRGEMIVDDGNGPKECARGLVIAVALVDALPESSLEPIEKMLS